MSQASVGTSAGLPTVRRLLTFFGDVMCRARRCCGCRRCLSSIHWSCCCCTRCCALVDRGRLHKKSFPGIFVWFNDSIRLSTFRNIVERSSQFSAEHHFSLRARSNVMTSIPCASKHLGVLDQTGPPISRLDGEGA